MIFETKTPKKWNLPASYLRQYNDERLKETLRAFNNLYGGNAFITDYFQERLIIDYPRMLLLLGYPEELALQKGFAFFERILKEEERERMLRISKAAKNFLYRYGEKWMNLMLFYDFCIQTKDGKELVFHRKKMPYKLCKNGNVWLTLSLVRLSEQPKPSPVVSILDVQTNKRYELVDDMFVPSDVRTLTADEREILRLMELELTEEIICEKLEISRSTYYRRREKIFEKLNASTLVEASFRAKLLQYI